MLVECLRVLRIKVEDISQEKETMGKFNGEAIICYIEKSGAKRYATIIVTNKL